MPEATAIRPLSGDDLEKAAAVIRAAFMPQARRFGLTRENCPGNGAFTTQDKLAALLENGAMLLGSFRNMQPTGVIIVKRAGRPPHRQIGDGPACYMEKLSVLPEEQRQGIGSTLLQQGLRQAVRLGAHSICIGIIAEAHELQRWYEKQGFTALGTKDFASLPFTVLYMGRKVP